MAPSEVASLILDICMLSPEQNASLTEVDAGTLAGDLLRRYWHPICLSRDLQGPLPVIRQVRLLGEDLLLLRTESRKLLLFPEGCPHRAASLYYGFVEGDTIRCAYHGWAFDSTGLCIERSFEPDAGLCEQVRLQQYQAEELGGIIFAYLGPQGQAPYLPKWDILVRNDGTRHFEVQDDLRCNWFQVQENALDVTHTYYLHSKWFERLGLPDRSGFNRRFRQYGFQPFEWGIIKSWLYDDPNAVFGWGNLMIFPNILRLVSEMHWRVPIDRVTTRIVWVDFIPDSSGVEKLPEVIEQSPRKDEFGRYRMDTFPSQDAMAFETPGLIVDRSREHLGASDAGIVLFRRMFIEQAQLVHSGHRPMAGRYPPDSDIIVDLRQWMGGDLPMSCRPDSTPVMQLPKEIIFDERHRVIRLGK